MTLAIEAPTDAQLGYIALDAVDDEPEPREPAPPREVPDAAV